MFQSSTLTQLILNNENEFKSPVTKTYERVWKQTNV